METSVTIFGQQLKPSSCDDDGVAEFDVRDATCTVDKKLVTSDVGLIFFKHQNDLGSRKQNNLLRAMIQHLH